MTYFILSLVLSFALCLAFGKMFLAFLTKKGIIQPIYDDAPEEHKKKAGTPTMGGITFLGTILVMLIIGGLTRIGQLPEATWIKYFTLFVIILGYGYIGFKDDFLKVTKADNQSGLTPVQKLLLQFGISALVIVSLYMTHQTTMVDFIFTTWNMGILYYIIVPVMLVGFSNATNLTDGLDGLLTTVSIIVFSTLAIIAFYAGNGLILFTSLVTVGSLCAFLVYNFNPAKMFMGDTGSLVLGVLFTYSILSLKIEVLGLILGLVYIFEVLSVTLQVGYFKYTKKKTGEGKRIFKMAPFHHHLEKSGMNEKKIVLVFAIVQVILSAIVLALYI